MVKATFYNYTGEPNRIDKTLSGGVEMQGLLYDATNVHTPVMTIESNALLPYNYVYVDALKRYYCINSQTLTDANHIQVQLTVDVLKTYESAIKQATGTFDETSEPNTFLNNSKQVYNIKPNIEKIDFDYTFDSTGNMIMVTLKS